MSVLIVTGTGTGVGKTVVVAALAALGIAAGRRVAVLKPAQTGVGPDELGDLDEIRRLVGETGALTGALTTRELARYPDPLAPATAAARVGRAAVTTEQVVDAVAELARDHDLVLVEGAGGLLVRFCAGETLADVAAKLDAPVLVVAAAGLGTLNHTALTTEVLVARGLRPAGVVIGSWPAEPDLAARCNLADLPAVTGVPLLGQLPAGAGRLSPGEFLATVEAAFGAAPAWLA
ncbi:MAG: dethiobiotin synthetase [Pseudonocardiales bacterium]|nr:dethiobiotin synthetase [Pseudonocardiales bacterium]MDT7663284.1 dethiobiotin synthetase [Pseudonocardiales bacterium]MDT7672866.1 dethiobiotin synthetase [Pseudonocardiales bacterium]MDT7693845.1 dethiobiotin synthetase [Pseudonocardiales bacterium]